LLSESFLNSVSKVAFDREALITMMHNIDETKRQIKSRLSSVSSGSQEMTELGPKERKSQIRKMTDKISCLAEEREYIRNKINTIKQSHKAMKRAVNSRNENFCHAFIAAAEVLLDEETFLEIEAHAATIRLQLD